MVKWIFIPIGLLSSVVFFVLEAVINLLVAIANKEYIVENVGGQDIPSFPGNNPGTAEK